MRTPDQLRPEELKDIVSRIQAILWLDATGDSDCWNADKEWDAEALDRAAAVLAEFGLRPDDPATAVDPCFVV